MGLLAASRVWRITEACRPCPGTRTLSILLGTEQVSLQGLEGSKGVYEVALHRPEARNALGTLERLLTDYALQHQGSALMPRCTTVKARDAGGRSTQVASGAGSITR